MASTFTITASLLADNGVAATINSGSHSKQTTTTGVFMGGGIVQAIGTSAEALNAPADVTYQASYLIQNNDPTNFVSLYVEAAGTNFIGKMYPGQFMLVTNCAVVPGLKADTGVCNIQFWIVSTPP